MEDLSTVGDITSESIIPENHTSQAEIVTKEDCVVAGILVAQLTLNEVDPTLSVQLDCKDGDAVPHGRAVLRVQGATRGILKAERIALNFLQRLSGVASLTAAFVEMVRGTRAKILDTRKTTPGLRLLEKYAVRVGGGHNHRFGLHDMVLVKENHIMAAGGIAAAINNARNRVGDSLKIVVEVTNKAQIREALRLSPDRLLLDNMSVREMVQAVRLVDGQAPLEVSGGVTLETVREIAETGVDFISVGALTHSCRAMDFSLLLTN